MRLVASVVVACLALAGGLTPNPASAYPTPEIPEWAEIIQASGAEV